MELILTCISIVLLFFIVKSHRIRCQKSKLEGRLQILELSFEKTKDLEFSREVLIKKLSEAETLLKERTKHFQDSQEEMRVKFSEMAYEILEKIGSQMEKKSRVKMEDLLEPFKDDLEKFKSRIESVHLEETKQRTSLGEQVKNLIGLNEKMTMETTSLTRALVGDNKIQGDWGEFQLEIILENSGLRSGEEFIIQGKGEGLEDDEGRSQKPDFLIKIPGEKVLIIDSKMSLKAYKNSIDHESDKHLRTQDLKDHLKSIVTHIDGLTKKHYQHNIKLKSPDFVVMFVPIESALSAALSVKKDLLEVAWKKKIVLATPTNLFAIMRTVASIWKMDQQNRNAEEIAKRGTILYDKIFKFVENMEGLGESIAGTQKKYNETFSKLSTGQGNLLWQIKKLEDLGIKGKKS